MTGATKEEARSTALGYCSDFIADWDRVYSIINSMEEALNVELAEAKDTPIESARVTRQKLAAADYGTGPRA